MGPVTSIPITAKKYAHCYNAEGCTKKQHGPNSERHGNHDIALLG